VAEEIIKDKNLNSNQLQKVPCKLSRRKGVKKRRKGK
jgi:hypothetical protein